MSALAPGAATSAEQVATALFRALAVVRAVVTAFMVMVNAARAEELVRPALAWTVVAVLVVWAGFVTWAYDEPRRRRTPLLATDLAISCLALLATPLVQSQEMLDAHASSLPTYAVVAAVLAWAVARGWTGGVAAAVVVSVCDLSVRARLTDGITWGNIFLLLLVAGAVGYSTTLLGDAAEARALAERERAALLERARLARVVHDGVLQVLALVQRRGAELGGEAAELGRLAGEQEVALRSLVQAHARGSSGASAIGRGDDDRDLVARLAGMASPSVTVSGPGRPVLLEATVVAELAAAVRACLDNVTRHVGDSAPAWVLVEDLGDEVLVTVRDEGPGIPPDRLERAAAEGRLGVRQSVLGRLADLGGQGRLVTGPGDGVEWELSVPRQRGVGA